MAWLRILIDCTQEQIPLVEEVFNQHGAISISLEDRQDQPVFAQDAGDMPLWNEVRITGLFDRHSPPEQIISAVETALGFALRDYTIDELIDQDWQRVWLKRFQPKQVGHRLWICPTQMQAVDPDAVTIFIDPGLAFGSGTHPTTAMCLNWLSDISMDNKCVMDYGCGSGILAIAALKLGADLAYAVDIDPQALIVSRENAQLNGVAERLITSLPDAMPESKQFEVLVANILSDPLVELAPDFDHFLTANGVIALSGILDIQAEEVETAYRDRFQLHRRHQDGWTLLYGSRV